MRTSRQITSLWLLGYFLILPGLFVIHGSTHATLEDNHAFCLNEGSKDCSLCDLYHDLSASDLEEGIQERITPQGTASGLWSNYFHDHSQLSNLLRGPPAV